MQIKGISANDPGMTVGRNIQGSRNQARPGNNLFGPQCRVTISREGRRLSRQQAARTEQSARSVKTDRMLRQQEEDARNENITKGYREELRNIEKTIRSLNGSYDREETGETIEEKQEVLRAMESQKQLLAEENQRRAREARQTAMELAGYQEDIDEDNRDLLTLLKTIENAEKSEERQENGGAKSDGGSGAAGPDNLAAGAVQNSTAQFTAASVKRELSVEETLTGLSDEGHERLGLADAITRNILTEAENIRAALDEERFTDDEKAKIMEQFRGGLSQNYRDVSDARHQGLQNLQDARDCRIKHMADNPISYMI